MKDEKSEVPSSPLLDAEAVGRLKKMFPEEVEILKSVPVLVVEKVKLGPDAPLIVVVAPPPEQVPLSVFPAHNKQVPAVILEEGAK